MPDPITTAANAVVQYGWFGALVAALFKVPPDVVIAAFVGSLFAVMVLHELSVKNGAMLSIGVCFAVSIVTPDISKHFDFSQAAIAFIVAFALVYFWTTITDAIKNRIKSWGGTK